MSNCYDEKFYDCERDSARRDAKEIVPIILEVISPKSVIDNARNPFYLQNMLIFAKKNALEHDQLYKKKFENTNSTQLSLANLCR